MNAILQLLLDHPRSENRWIGLEIERFILGPEGRVLRYKPTIHSALRALTTEGWKMINQEESHLLGVEQHLTTMTLEPGAQWEVSLAPRKSLFEIRELDRKLSAEVLQLQVLKDAEFLDLGLNPREKPEDIPLLPSRRYELMDAYYKENAPRGPEMMRLSAGLHINLDYETETQALSMMRGALILAPFLSAMFANSPLRFGESRGFVSERHFVWKDHDPLRSGIPMFAFDEDFSLERYCEYVANIPLMYAYGNDRTVFAPQGASFHELANELKPLNALAALRQVFTEVRFKPCCVEIRFLDALPENERYAAAAMVVGLLYDDENQFIIRKRFRDSIPYLTHWMDLGAERGVKAEPFKNLLPKLLDWAEAGLLRRDLGEEEFLAPAERILSSGLTPAERYLNEHPL